MSNKFTGYGKKSKYLYIVIIYLNIFFYYFIVKF